VSAQSEPAESEAWCGERVLIAEVLERDCGNSCPADAHLCGRLPMIVATITVLEAKGIFCSRIRFDRKAIIVTDKSSRTYRQDHRRPW
jgi:NAD(P)H-flavin reductase